MLKEFKELVDVSQAVLPKFINDYVKICRYLDIDISYGYASSWVTDELRRRIDTLLAPIDTTDMLTPKIIEDLCDALVYESVLNDVDNSLYLTILEVTKGMHQNLRPLTDLEEWHEAIIYAKDYECFSPNVYTVQHKRLRERYTKVFDIANAAAELRNLGCQVHLNDVVLEITSGLEAVAASIEADIKDLDAIQFINSLFIYIKDQGYYNGQLKRYVIVNPVQLIPSQSRQILPFGFLLNLAIKHLVGKSKALTNDEQQQRFRDALHKANLLATVLDLRNYGSFDLVFQPHEKLPQFISRLALFDSAYSIISNDPNEIEEYLVFLFDWLDKPTFATKMKFSPDDFIAIYRSIIAHAPENGPLAFTFAHILSWNQNLNAETLKAVLQRLSHQADTVNKDYCFPYDYPALDFGFKPLIQVPNNIYVMADHSWCATAFFEVLAACCREVDKETDNKIGMAAERYFVYKCQQSGINVVSGDYADEKGNITGEGEADGLIESKTALITIESKKKPLTRRARGGSDIQLLIDLAGSLLAAQVQSGRTEIKLRQEGHIYLNDKKQNTRIDLNGRRIERIAMSVLDFGSFQDRSVINGLLTNLANVQYNLIDTSDRKDVKGFAELEKKRVAWTIQTGELKSIDPDFDQFPFFNCWFLSLSQLLMMIQFCKNSDDFEDALKATRHTSFGTGNFYYEFYQLYILKKGLDEL